MSEYPHEPGHRGVETSVKAAEAMKIPAGTLRALVLDAIKSKPRTSFQLSADLHQPFESIQPRTSELCAAGLIEDSGARGPSRSPRLKAIVWRAL